MNMPAAKKGDSFAKLLGQNTRKQWNDMNSNYQWYYLRWTQLAMVSGRSHHWHIFPIIASNLYLCFIASIFITPVRSDFWMRKITIKNVRKRKNVKRKKKIERIMKMIPTQRREERIEIKWDYEDGYGKR